MKEKILAPVIVGKAPRVRDAELRGPLEVIALWAKAIKAAIHAPHGSVSSLDVGMEENALEHHYCTRGIGGERTNRVMGIVRIKTTEYDFTTVLSIVAVCVANEDQV